VTEVLLAPHALTHWLDERRTARASGPRPADFTLAPGDVAFLHEAPIADPRHLAALTEDAQSSGALVRLTGKGAL